MPDLQSYLLYLYLINNEDDTVVLASQITIKGGRGGHAAMNPAISCSNPGSSQNPVRTLQKPAPTPRKPARTPQKTVQKITF